MKSKTTCAGWIAGVFCILSILFINLFALDSFEQGTLLQKFAAFGMHMIPSLILSLVLAVAWKMIFFSPFYKEIAFLGKGS